MCSAPHPSMADAACRSKLTGRSCKPHSYRRIGPPISWWMPTGHRWAARAPPGSFRRRVQFRPVLGPGDSGLRINSGSGRFARRPILRRQHGSALRAGTKRPQLFQGRRNPVHELPCRRGTDASLLLGRGTEWRPARRSQCRSRILPHRRRPIGDDVGLGGVDGFGKPLSRTVAQNPGAIDNVQGLFKTPGLRNIEFTGPYQHNGGQSTLEQVIDFYARGGDFPGGGNLGPGIGNHNLSATTGRQSSPF